jgi:hypothetical protein
LLHLKTPKSCHNLFGGLELLLVLKVLKAMYITCKLSFQILKLKCGLIYFKKNTVLAKGNMLSGRLFMVLNQMFSLRMGSCWISLSPNFERDSWIPVIMVESFAFSEAGFFSLT